MGVDTVLMDKMNDWAKAGRIWLTCCASILAGKHIASSLKRFISINKEVQ